MKKENELEILKLQIKKLELEIEKLKLENNITYVPYYPVPYIEPRPVNPYQPTVTWSATCENKSGAC